MGMYDYPLEYQIYETVEMWVLGRLGRHHSQSYFGGVEDALAYARLEGHDKDYQNLVGGSLGGFLAWFDDVVDFVFLLDLICYVLL